MYTLYVIPGSHACRSAMLMLEHKQLPYRRVDLVTLLHPILASTHGFDAGGQRAASAHAARWRCGSPTDSRPCRASAFDDQRISTNHRIARFLEGRHSEPPLFPSSPQRRSEVEQAERWANDTLQDGWPQDPHSSRAA